MKYIRVMVAALVLGVMALAVGCSSTVSGSAHPVVAPPSQGTNHASETQASAVPSDDPATYEDPTPTPTGTGPAKFGQRYSWEDGLVVTVSVPKRFTPSEYAAADPAPAYVYFQVTIVNGTTSNYDPSVFSVSAQSGNTEASEVFDSENGFEGSPSTRVTPNREVTFKVGFGVQNQRDIVLDVTPGFDYDDALFSS